eukprot:4917-Heterococcus_DN1.PRE.2
MLVTALVAALAIAAKLFTRNSQRSMRKLHLTTHTHTLSVLLLVATMHQLLLCFVPLFVTMHSDVTSEAASAAASSSSSSGSGECIVVRCGIACTSSANDKTYSSLWDPGRGTLSFMPQSKVVHTSIPYPYSTYEYERRATAPSFVHAH